MKDCTSEIDTCAGTKENDDDYKCYAKDENSDCTWTLLCSKVPKPASGSIECSDYPVSDSTKYKECVADTESNDNACKEVKYSCSEVPKLDDGTEVTCSEFDVTNKDTQICVQKTETRRVLGEGDEDEEAEEVPTQEYACEEKVLCGKTELTLEESATAETECPKYPTTSESKGGVKDTDNKCKEVYLCSKVTKEDKKNGNTITCSSLAVSDSSKYYCDDAPDSEETNLCKEVKYCEEATKDDNDKECKDRKTRDSNKICQPILGGESPCQAKYLCQKAPINAEGKCADYILEKDNNIYSCEEDTLSYPKCKEIILCNQVTEALVGTGTIDCSKFAISSVNKGNYVCIQNVGSTTSLCKEERLCSKITDLTNDSEEDCLKYPVEIANKDTHGCIRDGTACVEANFCHGNKDQCPKHPVPANKIETHTCIKKGEACIEETFCEKVKSIENGKTCSDYPVKIANSDTHICIENTGTTKADQPCQEIELCTDGKEKANGANCQDYPVAKEDRETKGCFLKDDSHCGPKDLCALVEASADPIDCSNYPVSWANRKTHKCVALTSTDPNNKACEEKEITFCLDTNADPQNCNDYPIKDDDGTKKCVKNEAAAAATPCTTETLKCAEKTTGATNAICAKLTLEDQNKDCKLNGDSCEEKEKETVEPTCLTETDVSKCNTYTFSDVTKKCVENTNKSEGQTTCIEQIKNCKEIEEGATNNICGKLKLEDNNKTCKSNGEACVEIEKTIADINCIEGEDNNACTYYKVADITTQKCVRNTNTTEGASICVEETLACEEVTTDATDEVCKKLTLENDEETVCKKDSKENKCVVITYCEHGNGASDDECGKFAVKGTNKECKKKKNEGVCEEVTKAQTNTGSGSLIRTSISLLLLFAILI